MGIFGTFPKEKGHELTLLAFTPLPDERDLNANQHIELISDTLEIHGKTPKTVVAPIADNCENYMIQNWKILKKDAAKKNNSF